MGTIRVVSVADHWAVTRSTDGRTLCITACRSRAIDFAATLAKRTGAELAIERDQLVPA